jgi:nicotinate-nucleotide adenylyltransferase
VRIGILGGTFNPPHLGHLICAQEAYLQLGLDGVTLIPARVPPHKPVEDEPGAEHRLELCRVAIQGDERFDVSDLEVVREGLSYTVDTLEELHSSAPDHELFLIVGGDIAAGLPSWHRAERVLSLATVAVARRRGTSRAAVEGALSSLPGGERARFFRMPRIGISSTMLRDRVRAGKPIKYYVPDPVERYIYQHRLYAGVGSIR